MNGFVEHLVAGGYFLPFAVCVGIIVSIDVFVVEVTRDYSHADSGKARRKKNIMSITHALMHMMSFLIYTLAIYGLQGLTLFSIDLFGLFFDIPGEVFPSLLVLANFIIILFVWWTYRSKIKEDHSEKSVGGFEPDRTDMKLFVGIVRSAIRRIDRGGTSLLSDYVPGLAIAGAVAVDMLAISALLKNWLIPNGDIAPIAQLTGHVVLDVCIFSLVIFFVVFLAVHLAHGINEALRGHHVALIILRVAEPFAVFYIMSNILHGFDAVLETGVTSALDSTILSIIDIGFATLMTLSLLVANRIGWRSLKDLALKRSRDTAATERQQSLGDLFGDLHSKLYGLGWALVMLVVVFVCLVIAYGTGRMHNHIVEATAFVSMFVTIALTVVLYFPSVWMDRRERARNKAVFSRISCQDVAEFGWTFWGTLMALSTINLYFLLTLQNSISAKAVMFWSAYLLLASGLYNLRRWRFCKTAGLASGEAPARQLDADNAEFTSAVGLASSLIAVTGLLWEYTAF